jgi:hypothetical protein
MVDHVRRGLTEVERWIAEYEGLVEGLASDGYGMCVTEYANDLACQQFLYERRHSIEVTALSLRFEKADARFRGILHPLERCFHGDYPRECFWFWGVPPNSGELSSDLTGIGAL